MKTNKFIDFFKKIERKDNDKLILDFMPQYMEIIERPPNKSSKVIIGLLVSLIFCFIAWASFSKVDVIVSGQGMVVSHEGIAQVKPLYPGQLVMVSTSEGQQVKTGQVLAKLVDKQLEFEIKELETSLHIMKIQKEVYQTLDMDIATAIAIENYSEMEQPFVNAILAENDYYRKQSQIGNSSLVLAQYKMIRHSKIAELDGQMSQILARLTNQYSHQEALTLHAPIEGTVQSIIESPYGQAVGVDDIVATIVPFSNDLVFEGYLSDKDRGSIIKDMPVEVKLQAYSYQDYGTIVARLDYISPAAILTEKGEVVYKFKAILDPSSLEKFPQLGPGMSGVAELKLGERTVLDYFLEPITKPFSTGFKEK